MKELIKTILFLTAIAAYLAILVVLISFSGATTLWFGFVILWYWGMVAKAEFKPIHSEILPGILVGMTCVYIMHTVPDQPLITAAIPFLLLICSIKKWLTRFINRSTFLALTVLTIPDIDIHKDILDLIIVALITIAYIALTAYIKDSVVNRKPMAASKP